MDNRVKRIFVEKKPGFDVEARALASDLRDNLGLTGIINARIINRYDIEGLDSQQLALAVPTIFSEPNVDQVYYESMPAAGQLLISEYLPGQYDQRADSAAQCCQLLTGQEAPLIRCARIYAFEGRLSEEELGRIENYIINPVESRKASPNKPDTLKMALEQPDDVEILSDFINYSDEQTAAYHKRMGFAMSPEDLIFVRDFFRREGRAPTQTELKVIDTYWSDHCRHTTFLTRLDNLTVEEGKYSAPVKDALALYMDIRRSLKREDKPVTLMDMATIAAKELRRQGYLDDLDVSDENNACSIVVNAPIDGREEKWLIMFKNETHNHPTEIEPFGGAATCLGGAIRDPLSGRSYVYQAMRVTGAADPRVPVEDTMPNKLPQRKITTGAAAGYSSYGNQIGLATGLVHEIYHPGYAAKRLEIGAVVGAAPYENVRRAAPEAGDVILLLGGATGRDGCGGATGSSKAHTLESLSTCGAEVQKGNPPTERKLQRLFRNKECARLIKKCNDFGAGGVCVAIGELADGLDINLDAVPKKYEGLSGTELAISESQERMAVVLDKADCQRFIELAALENLDAVPVAKVTDTGRMRMFWRGSAIVDIPRAFLNTNGVTQRADAFLSAPAALEDYFHPQKPAYGGLLEALGDLNSYIQKGLAERFDSTIGAGSVVMPFGGKEQLTPVPFMAAKLPAEGETSLCTVMSWGFDPALSSISPFHGAYYAVVESLAKLACSGADISGARLTQQEYFERLRSEPARWGKPAAALLGSIKAQMDFKAPSIGGKDSMSGSFMELDVPPTLVNFAIVTANTADISSPEFKEEGNYIGLLSPERDAYFMPDADALKARYTALAALLRSGEIAGAMPVGRGGAAAAAVKMCLGNNIGAALIGLSPEEFFADNPGAVVFETRSPQTAEKLGAVIIGRTGGRIISLNGEQLTLQEAAQAGLSVLDRIYPVYGPDSPAQAMDMPRREYPLCAAAHKNARPRVLIPVFPGTNCEYDSARAFERAGGEPEIFVLRNRTPEDIAQSLEELTRLINSANILFLPGGFSGGDEPDGSGKFIATVLRNPRVSDTVNELLYSRDGLALGICNGFQALVKTGLLPGGRIAPLESNSPTLTFNTLGRHISAVAHIRVAGNNSPWLSLCRPGEIYAVPVSHGEGRFWADADSLEKLAANGQIATQYCSPDGKVDGSGRSNLNGSVLAIEGIISPDGRVMGKMGHTERAGRHIMKNVPGNYDMKLFEAGCNYFK